MGRMGREMVLWRELFGIRAVMVRLTLMMARLVLMRRRLLYSSFSKLCERLRDLQSYTSNQSKQTKAMA